jgi:integrase
MGFVNAIAGGRKGEICSLHGDKIFLNSDIPYAIIPTFKQKQKKMVRAVPIHPKIIDPLKKLVLKHGNTWLFPSLGKSILRDGKSEDTVWAQLFSKKWILLATKVVPRARIHAWRGCAISAMTNAGVSQKVIDEIVGHAKSPLDKAYLRLHLPIKLEAIMKIY